MPSKKSTAKNLLFPSVAVVASCLVGVVFGELLLRMTWPGGGGFYIWPPHLETEFTPREAIVKGVSKTVSYSVNSKGVRAPEWSGAREMEYRILTIGGSTTECILLDQKKAWPAQLKNMLGKTADGRDVWIGNLGHAGDNTRDHIAFMKLALDQYDVDALILLTGINDFGLRLNQGESYDANFILDEINRDSWLRSSFALLPVSIEQHGLLRSYRGTAIYQSLKWIRQSSWRSKRLERDANADWIDHARARRARAHLIDTLPPLESGLAEYSRNIGIIAEEARRRSIDVIFLTQPAIWNDELSPAEEEMIWWGLGPGEEILTTEFDNPAIFSVSALTEGMRAYNQALLQTCEQQNLNCFDIAALIPQNAQMYYDDAHFTEAGAHRFAFELTGYMSLREPFHGK